MALWKKKPITLRMANYNFKTHSMIGADTGYYVNKENWPHDGRKSPIWIIIRHFRDSQYDDGALVLKCPEMYQNSISLILMTGCSIESYVDNDG